MAPAGLDHRRLNQIARHQLSVNGFRSCDIEHFFGKVDALYVTAANGLEC